MANKGQNLANSLVLTWPHSLRLHGAGVAGAGEGAQWGDSRGDHDIVQMRKYLPIYSSNTILAVSTRVNLII